MTQMQGMIRGEARRDGRGVRQQPLAGDAMDRRHDEAREEIGGIMQTAHVVMILACDQHAETTRRMLDEAHVGNWVVLSGEQARRVGHLQYTPLWPSTSSRVIFGFAERTVIEQMLQALTQAVHRGKVCPTCLAFTWEAQQPLTPSPARDPVCGTIADCDHSIRQTYRGTTYYFCSSNCRDRFIRDPDMYV